MSNFTPVLVDDDFTVSTERLGQMLMMHMDVHRWTPALARRFRQTFQDWFLAQGEPVFAAQFLDGPPTFKTRFATGLGFWPVGEATYKGARALYYTKTR